MGGLDFLAFTGGIGEHTPVVRELVMNGLEFLGVQYNAKVNAAPERGATTELSVPGSRVKVYIIPTNEELVIARETLAVIGGAKR